MFNLIILTLEKTVFDDAVQSVIVPGAEGFFEVLSHHTPFIALIKPGKLEIETQKGQKLIYALSGGFFEFSSNKGTLIADDIELAAEIDLKRAQKALEKAMERLASADTTINKERAKDAANRAENRVKIYLEFH